MTEQYEPYRAHDGVIYDNSSVVKEPGAQHRTRKRRVIRDDDGDDDTPSEDPLQQTEQYMALNSFTEAQESAVDVAAAIRPKKQKRPAGERRPNVPALEEVPQDRNCNERDRSESLHREHQRQRSPSHSRQEYAPNADDWGRHGPHVQAEQEQQYGVYHAADSGGGGGGDEDGGASGGAGRFVPLDEDEVEGLERERYLQDPNYCPACIYGQDVREAEANTDWVDMKKIFVEQYNSKTPLEITRSIQKHFDTTLRQCLEEKRDTPKWHRRENWRRITIWRHFTEHEPSVKYQYENMLKTFAKVQKKLKGNIIFKMSDGSEVVNEKSFKLWMTSCEKLLPILKSASQMREHKLV